MRSPLGRTGTSGAESAPDSLGQHSGETRRLSVLRFAVLLGLLAWAGEYAVLLNRRFGFGERASWYLESMWLAAFVYAAVFAALGVSLTVLVRRRPQLRRAAYAFITGVAAFCGILVFRSVHWLAALLLAAGLGYQLGAMIVSHEERFERLVRRLLPPVLGTSALIVIGLIVLEPLEQWRGYAALPPASPDSPNVLFLILDTVTAHDLSLYGYDRPTTPWLEGFARDAVVFDRAFSTARWTLPSHYSLFTGLYPHEMPSGLSGMMPPSVGEEHRHVAEVLADRGYATAGFVANMSYTIDETGLNRGFILWDDHTASAGQIGISTAAGRAILSSPRLRRLLDWHDVPIRKHASRVNAAMLHWLDDHGDRPFFVFANYFDAHNPYLPPEPFASRFTSTRPRAPLRYHPHTVAWVDETNPSAEESAAERGMYDGALAWLDSELRELFEALDSRGLLDNTLVILAADHGESFGLHGRLGHGRDAYEELVHVPLLISFRGHTPDGGLHVPDAVTLADLPATILDLVGDDEHPLPGKTLATAWDADHPGVPRSPILAAAGTGQALEGLFQDRWHYLRHEDGREELYDLVNDATEQKDLAADPQSVARLGNMRKAFDRAIAIRPEQRSTADYATTAIPKRGAVVNR